MRFKQFSHHHFAGVFDLEMRLAFYKQVYYLVIRTKPKPLSKSVDTSPSFSVFSIEETPRKLFRFKSLYLGKHHFYCNLKTFTDTAYHKAVWMFGNGNVDGFYYNPASYGKAIGQNLDMTIKNIAETAFPPLANQ